MGKTKKDIIKAKGLEIEVYTEDFKNDYISLTDIAKYRNSDDPRFVIQNRMRNRNTLEFIGLWQAYIMKILTMCNSIYLEMSMD